MSKPHQCSTCLKEFDSDAEMCRHKCTPIQVQITSIDQTLSERGAKYGSFVGHANITQAIKDCLHDTPNWDKLANDQKECLEMIAHKIGRILNGDPNYHDSWHDIVGYTKLVADRLLTGETK